MSSTSYEESSPRSPAIVSTWVALVALKVKLKERQPVSPGFADENFTSLPRPLLTRTPNDAGALPPKAGCALRKRPSTRYSTPTARLVSVCRMNGSEPLWPAALTMNVPFVFTRQKKKPEQEMPVKELRQPPLE